MFHFKWSFCIITFFVNYFMYNVVLVIGLVTRANNIGHVYSPI